MHANRINVAWKDINKFIVEFFVAPKMRTPVRIPSIRGGHVSSSNGTIFISS